MSFSTLTFCVFLALVFGLHWTIPERGRNLLLVLASYFFYGWWDPRFCWLMLASSLLDFGAALVIDRSTRPGVRRAALVAAMTGNLALLGFFKYFNFFADSLWVAGQKLGWSFDRVTLDVVLPVGISFYTFQTMSYTIDVYRGDLRATSRLVDYLCYVSFFPQLVAGPIERGTNLLPQFLSPRVFDAGEAAAGCRLILWGFFKKMALADNLAVIVDRAYGHVGEASGPELLLATLAFAFQIYCDFSAYSDIAIGTGRLFGVRLMRNFAYPYFSRSVAEFWRRWHISLSTWFGDYVYRPLGGSRGSRARTVRNVMAVFLLSGLWHGAAWHFVAWGLLNGLAMLPSILFPRAERVRATDLPGGEGAWPSGRALLQMGATFAFTCLAWVFFRAPDLGSAFLILGRIGAQMGNVGEHLRVLGENMPMVQATLVFVVIEWMGRRDPLPLHLERAPLGARWASYTALIWITLYLAPATGATFIYFQF
jgi:alginate O-acetyltransferase complex protein AlgI